MAKRSLTPEELRAADRLRARWDSAKTVDAALTQQGVAFEFGWNQQSAVSQYLNKVIPLNTSALLKFAKRLGCAPAEIYPEMAAKHGLQFGTTAVDENPQSATLARGPDIRGRVPLISWVQAGSWSDAADPYSVGDAEDWLPCPVSHGPRTFCLRVRGLSMYNPSGKHSYSEGDVIFVDPDRRASHSDRVIVRLEDERETTLKQLIEEGADRYLRALNPSWPEPIIKVTTRATICGVVIGKWSE